MSVLSRPIRSLPGKDAAGRPVQVSVSVVPMTRPLIALWVKRVQPLIDANYKHSAPSLPPAKTRADVGWNWWHNYYLAAGHSMSVAPVQAMCLVVKQLGAPEFPIGMLTVVPKLQCNAFGIARERGFGWYLSDAPFEAYQQILKIPTIKGVAAALIDCSIQATLDVASDGTHLLHADPYGGEKLVRFYRDTSHMTQLPKSNGPVTAVIRRFGNPEEYFHFEDAQARIYCASYDPRR